MSMFLAMDAAVVGALTENERGDLDPNVYTAILEACVGVAKSWRPDVNIENPIPRPPACQWIRADLVVPDDFVWRIDLSFDQVAHVSREAGEVVIAYHGNRTTIHQPTEHIRVATCPEWALAWNVERAYMGEETLRSVAEAYGVF